MIQALNVHTRHLVLKLLRSHTLKGHVRLPVMCLDNAAPERLKLKVINDELSVCLWDGLLAASRVPRLFILRGVVDFSRITLVGNDVGLFLHGFGVRLRSAEHTEL